ncbi:Reticulon-domain-containing protein [Mucor lusitanicus]|uniref:Reticulon-like protein n=2 Tax=Mucor circinelloides f. lusitanicus TaxID=29924 RepID=A0A168GR09_MUCCL|nr:Reticulon-domain-containing protein [Mucor lusitanicus]OAC97947.1 hypothetical protein MUCCIDRAFT_168093 [Mucor lusitanicus CBS 277.49]
MTQILPQQQAFHNFDTSSKNAVSVGPRKNVAPPSPQMSQDDLVRELSVMDKHEISPTTSTGLLSPSVCDSPKHQASDEEVEDEEEDMNDITLLMYMEFMDLIYWEIPGRSGIILAGILSSLILTRYYSLLYVFAATLTILTGFNLVFVNAYNLIRTVWTGLPVEEFLHPYHIHIRQQRSSLISRDIINYYVHKSVDILELVAQQTAKIVLVEDTKTTGLACLVSAVIYVLTSLIPTKVFFGLLVLALFTVPYFYEKHQDVVDEQLQSLQEKSQVLMDKYGAVVRQQANVYSKQIMDASVGLGGILQQQIQNLKAKASSTSSSDVSTAAAKTTTDNNSVDTKTGKQ